MPKIAVIVPVHDGARTLERCLAALVAALPADAEIIVVDDGSTDASAAIAERFPVRLVRRSQRGGASAARNTGVAATDAELIVFVDADVVVRPDALTHLIDAVDHVEAGGVAGGSPPGRGGAGGENPGRDPRRSRPRGAPPVGPGPDAAGPPAPGRAPRVGANGVFALDLSTPGLVTAFTNTSIRYQHLSHGRTVSSAFTGLCVLRRDALEAMGGWDERTSRFADDVRTRWHLPPGSIALVEGAQGDHLKPVSLRGLLKHRYGVGYFFVDSMIANWGVAREKPERTVLALRYPLNTLAAGLTIVLLPALPAKPSLLLIPIGILVVANADFVRFTLRHRGPVEAAVALPISALEGYAYGLGMGAGLLSHLRRSLGDAPAPAR